MIRIEQINLPLSYQETDLRQAVCRHLKLSTEELVSYKIIKRSLDARKTELHYVFIIDAEVRNEAAVMKRFHILKNVKISNEVRYSHECSSNNPLRFRPVVVGAGPAGLFCALNLARCGYAPILIERGDTIEHRTKKIEHFWETGVLDLESNVQFGEGGAGTYSDGKLNTMVKDTRGRIKEVLRTFVEFGAPEEILYVNKPHIGTDLLRSIIKQMTEEIVSFGGSIRYRSRLTDIYLQNNVLQGIQINQQEELSCDSCVLAIGHSARDSFYMLLNRGLPMEQKAFAVGIRIEHPQSMINLCQYGDVSDVLPPADYKLTHTTKSGRGVYSFCMCPGGFVVNASSEAGRLAINGMSNHKRDEVNANSALVVGITPVDFTMDGKIEGQDRLSPLLGVEFQRKLEEKAFICGRGAIPVQLYTDLCQKRKSVTIGDVVPNTKGSYSLANLWDCLPNTILEALIESIPVFGRRIPGFDREDAVCSGVESRTSSPVRILRDETLMSRMEGIYPCGEGAGYAGGIVSAAVDGIKVFEAISGKHAPH